MCSDETTRNCEIVFVFPSCPPGVGFRSVRTFPHLQVLMNNIILRTSADDVTHLVNALSVKAARSPALDHASITRTAGPAAGPNTRPAAFAPLLKPSMSVPAESPFFNRTVVRPFVYRNFSRSTAGLTWSSSSEQLFPPATPPARENLSPTYRDLTYVSTTATHYRAPMTARVPPSVFNHHRAPFHGGPPAIANPTSQALRQPFVTPFNPSPRQQRLDNGRSFFDNVTLVAYGQGFGHQN